MAKTENALPKGLSERFRYTSERQPARIRAWLSSRAIWLPDRSSTSSRWASIRGKGKRLRRHWVISRLRKLGNARRNSSGICSRRMERKARIETCGKLTCAGSAGNCCKRLRVWVSMKRPLSTAASS
ncbi:hypothetical protein D3C79_856560 [compost metagenome]